ncbi:PD-(D/E)XK nuclease-like domain-containing protein [Xenorhabdus hominickii]|uniref:Exodeoxyribonuclease VIII n=1 Tax=Xenorhabdus hominickii TaxID=351679 RepID=A0A2G0Q5S8_XENHO|nr:PD-(D/E)XK nuclease-like domain-containing protein [Xenorhabdus hominickii]AOM39638.1 exodeoxyribonuclease VIII [Xenorhabdus hominickii]PHM54577.1 exodeoxyribonuclease VIII [Xenorhabdus hominickii]
MNPGIYYDISNEDYHKDAGVSKSQLDDIEGMPAEFICRRDSPIDEEKTKALDIGTALHCLLLEPNEFSKRFAAEPELDKRTKLGKEEAQAFNLANRDKIILTHEENRKLLLMRDSAMVHPTAKSLLEVDGKSECSIYWEDSITGTLCRSRPDRLVENHHWIVDVKTTADINKFDRTAYEYRYHVQDAFYSDGYKEIIGETPTFAFIVVSTTVNCGRYPVRTYIMTEQAKSAGRAAYQRNLATYAECLKSNEWPGLRELSLPHYAKERRDE